MRRWSVAQEPGVQSPEPPPAAAHVARKVHKLILIASVSRQVSLSLKPPIMRVAIVRDRVMVNSVFHL